MTSGTKQVVFIHGGNTHASTDDFERYLREYPKERLAQKLLGEAPQLWSRTLQEALGEGWTVLAPSMPCAQNARYAQWKLWMDNVVPFLQDDVVLVGHSLGGIFLAKYLIEHSLPVRISQLHLVAAPIDDTPQEPLGDFAPDTVADLARIDDRVPEIYIYHSEDDPVVPFADAAVYAHYLPNATMVRFTDRGHFLDETFPELIARITQS